MNTSPNRTLPSTFAFLPLVALIASCGARSEAYATPDPDPEPRQAAAETPASEPRSSEPARQAVESKPAAKANPWSAEVLDTGVDLSQVKLAKKVVEDTTVTVTNASPDAHDHGGAETPQRPGTYTGGPPDASEHTDADSGFISVSESSAIHDFGSLTQGDKVTHSFELETSGDADVVVEEIKTSCGCTVARTQVLTDEGAVPYEIGKPLEPGSRLLVEAALDTKAKQGRVRSIVTVNSSDPRGNLQLQLMANVAPFFEITPRTLDLGKLRTDSVVEGEFTITSNVVDLFHLEALTDRLAEEVSVELVPESPDAEGRANVWTAKVTLGPDIPEGPRRNYQLMFESDQPMKGADSLPGGKQPAHQVHAFAHASVVGVIGAEPHYISFGLLREGQEVSRTVTIENTDEEFRLEEPTVSVRGYNGDFEHPEHVSFDLVQVEEGKAFDLTVTMRAPEGLMGTFRGVVVVHVGHPSKPELELPFTGVVRSEAGSAPAGK